MTMYPTSDGDDGEDYGHGGDHVILNVLNKMSYIVNHINYKTSETPFGQ